MKKTIDESWAHELKKSFEREIKPQEEKVENDEYYDILHIPFIKNFSGFLGSEFKKLNIGVVMKKGRTIGSVLMHLKPQRAQTETKDIVYGIQCSTCKKMYIGETGQKICQRRKQHQSDVRRKIKTNGIYNHLKENPDRSINWENQKILMKEANWRLRKIKESILIDGFWL